MSDSYRNILDRADAHFTKVVDEQGQNLMCRVGCTLCCHGLFEIGAADVSLIAEALDTLPAARRKSLIERGEQIVSATAHPDLREASPEEKEAFFSRTAEGVACPALDEKGACGIYAWRPIVCRTFGLPLREGNRLLSEVCELNFNSATKGETEAAAWDLLWEDVLGPEDEFTIPEAIVLASRLRKHA
jgi:Uncharacterised protein family (UPF0153).